MTTRYEDYQQFRKSRAVQKAAEKAAVRAEVKAARKAGTAKTKKPLKEIVSDFAYEL